jgi:hypothetical protein
MSTEQTAIKLEWDALWNAMGVAPGAWVQTTEAMYWQMLEAVPPAAQSRCAFLVGEAHHHNDEGRAVYACFQETPRGFFARYLTVQQFKGGELATVHTSSRV